MRVGIGTSSITPEDRQRVLTVLESGRLSAGPMTTTFEAAFAYLHGRRHAAMCNSGTGALQLAVQALRERHGWPDGAEVIVPAVTFVASINVILHNRLTPVLADVDPLTYNIDPEQAEACVSSRTVAIMPVHLFGQPANMTAIMDIARRYDLRVIEDSCETVAVRHRGRPVGSFGDFACFSTYMAHIVTTGVGGLALTDDDDLATMFRSLMNHGRDPRYMRIDDDEGLEDADLLETVWSRYRFTMRGQSFRATEMEAALGIGQLERLDAVLAARASVAAMLRDKLARPEFQLPHVGDGNEHAYMMFPILCRESNIRDRIVVALERGRVETRLMLPILGQPCYDDLDFSGPFPVARMIGERGFYIGCHQDMTEGDVAHVATTVEAALA
jgi:perosamine synthetase